MTPYRPSRLAAAAAGPVAGGLGLAAAELLAGLVAGAPSPILSIGALLIAFQPPNVKQIVVDLFSTSDKLVLSLAVLAGALILSAALGLLERSRPGWGRAGFVALGLLALFAALRDPLFDGLLAIVAAVLATGISVITLPWLLRLAAPRANGARTARMLDFDRRRFLGTTVALAGAAATSGLVGRVLLERRASAAAAMPPLPTPRQTAAPIPSGARLDVDGITPLVVPNDAFYRIDTSLLIPRLDASDWQLEVTGMVDHAFTLTYPELLAMPMFEQYVTIACVSNEVGGDLVGNALWRGVHLHDLLDRAGVQQGATQLVGESFDGWTCGFPTAWLDPSTRQAMVAVAMNGEALPPEHGFPARLIVPGLYGYVSATKWLTRIRLTTLEAFDAYWVPLGWAKEAPILTQSRIDVPTSGTSVSAGTQPIAGVAWAPDRGVKRVEVQIDGGAWLAAEMSTPISDATWVQWLYRWDATAGDHTISVRATDGTGAVQTDQVSRPAPDGARGHHTIQVHVG
ncbi:MAG TPA: molybdopterin-dependent oxidoreductase [Candidatus Limnocylindria bacterium]|nr:molybdopterin-dependent oxidoreductase [Candidatus Limnocylindria bacterium]